MTVFLEVLRFFVVAGRSMCEPREVDAAPPSSMVTGATRSTLPCMIH